jgi:hypothetical protein
VRTALETIKPINLLAPVSGIITHLNQAEQTRSATTGTVTNYIFESSLVAIDPGFNLSHFETLLELDWRASMSVVAIQLSDQVRLINI